MVDKPVRKGGTSGQKSLRESKNAKVTKFSEGEGSLRNDPQLFTGGDLGPKPDGDRKPKGE